MAVTPLFNIIHNIVQYVKNPPVHPHRTSIVHNIIHTRQIFCSIHKVSLIYRQTASYIQTIIIPGTHLNFVIKYKSRSISIEIITDSCITVFLVIKLLYYVLRTTVLKKISNSKMFTLFP